MITLWAILAFLAGCFWTRLYYARLGGTSDWMKSSDWFSGRWWQKLHRAFCWSCPKRFYCDRLS